MHYVKEASVQCYTESIISLIVTIILLPYNCKRVWRMDIVQPMQPIIPDTCVEYCSTVLNMATQPFQDILQKIRVFGALHIV